MSAGIVHPIEEESYRIIASVADLSGFGELSRQVVSRVLHATADLGFVESMRVVDEDLHRGIKAIREGAAVVCDVEMLRAGIGLSRGQCFLDEARLTVPVAATADPANPTGTVSARAIDIAAERHPDDALFVIGCAPTALERLVDLCASGVCRPSLVIGLPVGFVGAAEAKERLRASGIASVSNVGVRGGSAAAAAAFNSIARLAATA